ncbi:MAG: hypothetical protein RXR03_08425 [Thermocladium sp.]
MGRDPYTRELLRLLRTWGYGESVLRFVEEMGLVERYRDNCSAGTRRKCLFNELTEKGLEYLEFLASAQSIRAWRRTRPLTSVPLIWLIR